MVLLPRSYFVVQGIAEDNLSQVNAFDRALYDAGIANYNLVCVSSILPFDILEDKTKKLPKEGSILFCVMSRIDGVKNEQVIAGIAIAKIIDRRGNRKFGLIVEGSSKDTKVINLGKLLTKKVEKMSRLRKTKIIELKKNQSRCLKIKKNYGTALVVAIFNDYELMVE